MEEEEEEIKIILILPWQYKNLDGSLNYIGGSS
jgi:hypothetical protein